MRKYFGYIRVSTPRQGERGVSLQEQHDAIVRFAERQGLEIIYWFEERETAAKRGRAGFNRMLKLLRAGKADGVIIHKIDRSARNLKDWADLGELIDQGIDVQFANESLDLRSRGGRLSADIQAVVAADYIRNLKEEIRKGFYGRIKQGLYPLRAPLGYLDKGGGKAKEIDPVKGPFVRKAFQLYATSRYNLDTLGEELFRLGLRNHQRSRVSRNGLSTLLNNPFYTGLIRLQCTGETFPGAHQPLIPKSLFDRVQHVLNGKMNARSQRHDFLFRRLLKCKHCSYSLIGERQKGHIYYRCHTRDCPTKCIPEQPVDVAVRDALSRLCFDDEEKLLLEERLARIKEQWNEDKNSQLQAVTLRLNQVQDRLGRLTDAYVDGTIDKALFENRKTTLLMEQKKLEEELTVLKDPSRSLPETLSKFLERANSAYLCYEMGLPDEKRDLLRTVTSNRQVDRKQLYLTLSVPFSLVGNRFQDSNCGPHRDIPRTWDVLLEKLCAWLKENPTASAVLSWNNSNASDEDGKEWKLAA